MTYLCIEPDCKKYSIFNYEGEKEGIYCFEHKKEKMIDVKNKKCIICKKKRPNFNIEGQKPEYCFEHKKENMIDVTHKKCREQDCKKIPNFNYEGEKEGKYCSVHKKEGMVDVKSKKCIICKKKQPIFNIEGQKPEYCFEHKKENMIDVINKRCKSCNLFQVLKNNNYLCSYCNKEKPKRFKTKENEVKQLLELNNIQFIHDKQVSNKCCYKYRPDFVVDCLYYYLIIEVDEDAHSSYDKECELIRMNNIQASMGLPTKFIRYNPDKKGIRKNIKKKELLERVKEWMKKELEELKTEDPVYLFY